MKKILLLILISNFICYCVYCQCPFVTKYVPKGVQQDNTMNCWAAALTMLAECKGEKDLNLKEYIKTIGDPFYKYYTTNAGLGQDDKDALVKKMKLRAEPPANYTIDAWCKLLKDYGALWVTTDENPDKKRSAIHARILYGILGDGTPQKSTMLFIDPASGKPVVEEFKDFIPKYEAELKKKYKEISGANWPADFKVRIQVIHW